MGVVCRSFVVVGWLLCVSATDCLFLVLAFSSYLLSKVVCCCLVCVVASCVRCVACCPWLIVVVWRRLALLCVVWYELLVVDGRLLFGVVIRCLLVVGW